MNAVATTDVLQRRSRQAFIAGGAGLFVCLVALFFARAEAFRAYWFGWVFWSGVGFGSLALLLLQFLTGGAWSRFAQRPAEAGAMTIPAMGFLLLPALFGLRHIFPWMNPQLWTEHAWPHKQAWLTPFWFVVRSLLYFAILVPIALFARNHSRLVKSTGSATDSLTLPGLGALGLILYVLCMNFASLDWVMSLEPQWTSTIFSYVFMIGQFLAALACTVVLLMLLTNRATDAGLLEPKLMRDFGNLLLAFVMFWAYVSFSQFLIIWSGNLPREISWYLHRRGGGWQAFVIFLAVVQFGAPFLLLLTRAAKQHRWTLGPIALLIFLANALAVYWQIAPSFPPARPYTRVLDLAAFVGIGGIWIALYLRALAAGSLVPAEFFGKEAHRV